jgi:hypothetical protein
MLNPVAGNLGVGRSILRDSKEIAIHSRPVIPRSLMLLALKMIKGLITSFEPEMHSRMVAVSRFPSTSKRKVVSLRIRN